MTEETNGITGKIPYLSLSTYLKRTYGEKLYKISLDGGFTCPNRDGLIDTRGCIFCSAGGSGDFAQSRTLSITQQLIAGRKLVAEKKPNGYIAYFQAFTGTYAPIDELAEKYEEALSAADVRILSIATRPDCLPEEVLDLLVGLRSKYQKEIWIELGLQTIHERSAEYIRRGYPLSVYDDAMHRLKQRSIPVITHIILGLPGESAEMMTETAAYAGEKGTWGVKLQLLHVLRGTDLAKEYEDGVFETLSLEEYADIVRSCIAVLPEGTVIHRITGDGDKKTLIAPLWSGDKKRVLNFLAQRVEQIR